MGLLVGERTGLRDRGAMAAAGSTGYLLPVVSDRRSGEASKLYPLLSWLLYFAEEEEEEGENDLVFLTGEMLSVPRSDWLRRLLLLLLLLLWVRSAVWSMLSVGLTGLL